MSKIINATRKFNETIDKENDTKFMLDGAQLTALLQQEDKEMENFEVEL